MRVLLSSLLRTSALAATALCLAAVVRPVWAQSDPAEAARRDALRAEAIALEHGEGVARDPVRAVQPGLDARQRPGSRP